eukprot:1160478-Pelagomonas_calceolata.AAC.6
MWLLSLKVLAAVVCCRRWLLSCAAGHAEHVQCRDSLIWVAGPQGMLSMYSAEADLMRHQTVIVLQLLAYPIHDPMPLELEERARLMLRIQVGAPALLCRTCAFTVTSSIVLSLTAVRISFCHACAMFAVLHMRSPYVPFMPCRQTLKVPHALHIMHNQSFPRVPDHYMAWFCTNRTA